MPTPVQKLKEPLKEGLYQMDVANDRYVVDVKMTMLGQWPSTREALRVFFLSGPPRMPWSVPELLSHGAKFWPLSKPARRALGKEGA